MTEKFPLPPQAGEFFADRELGKRHALLAGLAGVVAVAAIYKLHQMRAGENGTDHLATEEPGPGAPETPPESMETRKLPAAPEAETQEFDQIITAETVNQEPEPEKERPFGGEKNVAYEQSEGNLYVGSKFDQPGSRMEWRKRSDSKRLNRKILLTTDRGGQYYVRGDRVYDLTNTQNGRPASFELAVDEALPNLTIGEGWQIHGGTTDAISSVEIFDQKVPADSPGARQFQAYEDGGENTFAQLEARLAQIKQDKLDEEFPRKVALKAGAAKDKVKDKAIEIKDYTQEKLKTAKRIGGLAVAQAAQVAFIALEKAYDWTADRIKNGHGFAMAFHEGASDLTGLTGALYEADKGFEDYKTKDVKKWLGHQALIHAYVAGKTKNIAKESWDKRKTFVVQSAPASRAPRTNP